MDMLSHENPLELFKCRCFECKNFAVFGSSGQREECTRMDFLSLSKKEYEKHRIPAAKVWVATTTISTSMDGDIFNRVEASFELGRSLQSSSKLRKRDVKVPKSLMGAQWSHEKAVREEVARLRTLQKEQGTDFPGSDYVSLSNESRKEWMSTLDLDRVRVKDVCWPGTHDSATNKIGFPFVVRPFAQCQTLSVYDQLVQGVRVFDIRVEETGHVCHGILRTYKVDVVIEDVKRFLSETKSEFIIMEIRTEYQHADPPDFDKFLIAQFGNGLVQRERDTWNLMIIGEALVTQDQGVFDRTLRELLPHRVILIWKPQASPAPSPGSPLFSSGYIYDNWTDTDLPATKFEKNIEYLAKQQTNDIRKVFYRVENTATPQISSVILCVYPVTNRIRGFARLSISQIYKRGYLDRLQIFSSDFIEPDFVDACIGVTVARTKA